MSGLARGAAVTTCGTAWTRAGDTGYSRKQAWLQEVRLVGADVEEVAPPVGGRRRLTGDGHPRWKRSDQRRRKDCGRI
jgi:hypothetical protein